MKHKQSNEKIFEQRIGLLIIAGILLALIPSGASAAIMYSVNVDDDFLRKIDTTTGETMSSVRIILPPALSGFEIQNVNGLAAQPGPNTLFAVLTLSDKLTNTVRPSRELVTINPTTGAAADIGDTGDKFGGLTFAPNGILYGVTGDDPSIQIPSALFSIDTGTANPTFVTDFTDNPNNFFGEAIAYKDGSIYRASGDASGDTMNPLEPRIFQSYDLLSGTTTTIGISGPAFPQIQALIYDQSSGKFLGTTEGQLISITTTGSTTLGPLLDHRSKGLAPIPEFPTVVLPIASVIGIMFLFQRRKGK